VNFVKDNYMFTFCKDFFSPLILFFNATLSSQLFVFFHTKVHMFKANVVIF
jgi:hypothetical protein